MLRPEHLTTGERSVLASAYRRYVSAVSLWELAMLIRRRRIESDVRLLAVPEDYDFLPIRPEHCRTLLQLQLHHRDPFDRMLIAQALSERVPLLTRDRRIADYADEAPILRLPGP